MIHNGYPSFNGKHLSKKAIRKRLGLNEADEVLVFVARPVRHKGIEPLLIAMADVRLSHPNVRCAMIGSGHGFMDYQMQAKKVAANLIYTGQLTHDELRDWYAAADIGILSTYTEQCSFAALEMMQCGMTIVSSDGNNMKDMFINGQNAYVTSVGNVVDVLSYGHRLAETIVKALEAPKKERKRMTQYNYGLLNGKYSLETMAEGYVRLLHHLVGLS